MSANSQASGSFENRMQDISEYLKSKVIDPAETEKKRILEDAEAERKKILDDARAEAEKIIDDAKKEADKQKSALDSALHIASRQAVDSLKLALEKEVLKTADRVVVISQGMKQDFEQILPRDYKVITNGFDEDDVPVHKITPDQKFSIAHIGTLAKSRN
ncbi:MAG: hypothetical protein ACOCWH_05650, partial [Spirochaetota bacterium]